MRGFEQNDEQKQYFDKFFRVFELFYFLSELYLQYLQDFSKMEVQKFCPKMCARHEFLSARSS